MELGVTMSTIHQWLRKGILAGEQVTPGAPWRIVLTDEVRRKLSGGDAPEGWVGLGELRAGCSARATSIRRFRLCMVPGLIPRSMCFVKSRPPL